MATEQKHFLVMRNYKDGFQTQEKTTAFMTIVPAVFSEVLASVLASTTPLLQMVRVRT